jgi:hypothetical protein
MAIVKIFPKDPKKSDFSIRFFATKYHLFEGDKILRSNLKSEAEAEAEMNLIVEERIKAKLPEIKVVHNGFDPETKELTPYKRKHTYALKNCVICGEEFKSIRSNNIYCSSPCANNIKARLKRKSKVEKEPVKLVDVMDVDPKDFTHLFDHEKETQKTFDDLGKQAMYDKKRENFVSDLLDCIALQVKYEVMCSGAINWDNYYKTLIRMNLVYFNGVNMFLALTDIFGVDGYKKPLVLSSILNSNTVENAKLQGVRFMTNMNTFPSHAQHSALASLSLSKIILSNLIVTMEKLESTNRRVEQLGIEGGHSYKLITQLSTDVRSAENSLKNLNSKVISLQELVDNLSEKDVVDPFNRQEPVIRDYVTEDYTTQEGKLPRRTWWKKMFKF